MWWICLVLIESKLIALTRQIACSLSVGWKYAWVALFAKETPGLQHQHHRVRVTAAQGKDKTTNATQIKIIVLVLKLLEHIPRVSSRISSWIQVAFHDLGGVPVAFVIPLRFAYSWVRFCASPPAFGIFSTHLLLSPTRFLARSVMNSKCAVFSILGGILVASVLSHLVQ